MDIERALNEIIRDIRLIKRRLGIGEAVDETISDKDQITKDFCAECERLGVDLTGVDLVNLERSMSYFMSNKWRISNRQAYLKKLVSGAARLPIPAKKVQEEDGRVLGFPREDLIRLIPSLTEDIIGGIIEASGTSGKYLIKKGGEWTDSQKIIIAALGKQQGAIQ